VHYEEKMMKKLGVVTSALALALGLTTGALGFFGSAVEARAEGGDSPWLIRVRGIYVSPDESASVTGLAGTVEADGAVVPELDITYFFTDNIAAELILATSPHDMSATAGVDLGDVWVLPPTLLLQYHFTPKDQFRPYVGAGINYTIFYGEDSGAVASIDYEDGFGYALQAGMDYDLGNQWVFNIDVKKLWLNTDVSINGGAITADVDLDPWIFGAGFGYRF
jgi:outer membrane protein|tara:strand:- start:1248 stop:1913 length:666 start_codon:yes stop_codon:yes gene_type:complete